MQISWVEFVNLKTEGQTKLLDRILTESNLEKHQMRNKTEKLE